METIGSIINRIKTGKASNSIIKRIEYKLNEGSILYAAEVFKEFGTAIVGRNYELPDSTIIIDLLHYLHGNHEKYSGDLNKGLLLFGPVGTGKTTIFRIMDYYREVDDMKCINVPKNIRIPFAFKIVSSRQIVADFQEKGYEGLDPYLSRTIICIDDLGSEELSSTHYGTKCEVMNEIIERRYLDGKMTHFSTNLGVAELNNKYGERVFSRIKEMTNKYNISGKDRR